MVEVVLVLTLIHSINEPCSSQNLTVDIHSLITNNYTNDRSIMAISL